MKTNKLTKKIIVSTLAVAMGAALVGSISGTVAWYQYSTRVTAQMSGTSAGTSRNLQIASDAAVVSDKDNAAWDYNVKPASKADMAPSSVTFDGGVINGFVEHPVYQYFNGWKEADARDYFSYDLYFQSLKQNNVREAVDVYLTAFEITATADNVIKQALRAELVIYTTENGSTWTKQSQKILGASEGTTTIKDYLNLNNRDGGENYVMDHNGFAADDSDGVATMYKANTKVHADAGASPTGLYVDPELTEAPELEGGNIKTAGDYYKANVDSYEVATADDILTNDKDPYAFKKANGDPVDGSTKLFTTGTTYAVKMSVKVWIEGWQQTEDPAEVVLPAGVEATGYFSDEDLTEAANNYHEVAGEAGVTSAEGLYTTSACDVAVTPDENGKVPSTTTYYAKGVAADTYYTKGYIWDDATIGTGFQLNMRFGCQAER